MDLVEQLQSAGWSLSPEGYKTITEDGKLTNLQDVIQKALNIDIRDLGGCGFPSELTKGKCETVNGPIVVQIQKIRNISAPKANEESQTANRMLKLLLTDGSQVVPAIEMTKLSSISLNTPPGTKLRLKGEIIFSCGILQLNSDQVEMMGGTVTNLVDKWTVNRELSKHTRGRYGVEGGPPPWIPFGEKMAPTNLTDKNFKSLDDGSKENKDNDEFEAQRRDAIAEAGKGCTKKVFGGGTKPLMDKNVQAIMEKGFSIQQAEAALRLNRNNVDRALKSLTKRTGRGNDEKGEKEKEGGGRGRRKGEDEMGPKPSGRVCLFQYLEEKLPFLPEKEKTSKEPERKEWDNSHFNSRNSDSSFGGKPPRNNQGHERSRGGGNSGRGSGGMGHNAHNRDFTNTERKPRTEDSHKDGRNPRWQNSNHNQKPPRFQNQNKRIEQQTSEHFDHFITRSSDNGNTRTRNNADGYFASKSNSNGNQQSSTAQQYNGYRNSYKMDNMGQFNSSQTGGDHRNQSSSFFKPAGMPDIPEFPYKDSSSFAPIVSQSNSCIPDIPAFPYKDNSSFKPMPPTNSHSGNQVNSRNSSGPGGKQEKYRWNKGDKCIAKYWEDNYYYDAEVTGVSKKTCVVRFLDYGNFEEVLQDDCIPITEDLPNVPMNNSTDDHNSNFNSTKRNNNHFSGVLEFRRGGNRPYVKLEGMGPRKNQRQSQPVYMPPPSRHPK
uniref:Tudor domain-containing protein 3 n=1 Tax=Lygus hesperus TaxID=30085 RepID=A0A0A9W9G3_LYGHE